MDPIATVIADDHPIVRSGLRNDLADGFEIVGEADDAPTAIELITRLKPQLTICDIHMPGGGGLAVVARCAPMTRIVMLSVSDAADDVLRAVAAGAVGYLPKRTPATDLRDALLRAASGEAVFPPDLASLVLGEFRRLAATSAGPTAKPLSDREREVLSHVAKGHSYAAVGERLYISKRTVENHVRNILDKLHLERRDELVRWAVDHGLI